MPLNGMATNYYVDNTNGSASNSNAGTSPSLSWLTIGKCASTIVAGDTCNVLAGGIYIVHPTLSTSGTSSNRITYLAGAGTRPTVEGLRSQGRLFRRGQTSTTNTRLPSMSSHWTCRYMFGMPASGIGLRYAERPVVRIRSVVGHRRLFLLCDAASRLPAVRRESGSGAVGRRQA